MYVWFVSLALGSHSKAELKEFSEFLLDSKVLRLRCPMLTCPAQYFCIDLPLTASNLLLFLLGLIQPIRNPFTSA